MLTRDDVEEMKKLKEQLAMEFEIKDLGALKFFLGIELARSKQGIFISQRKYVLDLLKDVKPVTLLWSGIKNLAKTIMEY